ncbi:NIPSNAP family protein [Paraburkholderia aromaticivorans]|uniref:NIPSNAP family protein n=1 Tax=Paraburkholderia aromaticivorans TaxID=2026199 RepID=UPI001455E247|nr:NIPSNAP family protein [Paraburkholderia aromaticivorans]
MIVEERIYTVLPGKMKAFLTLVEHEGLPIQRPYLGEPLGYFTTETGELNQVVHWWGYESMADREQRRAQLSADPGWIEFAPKVLSLLARMENRILLPTAFSALGATAR